MNHYPKNGGDHHNNSIEVQETGMILFLFPSQIRQNRNDDDRQTHGHPKQLKKNSHQY